MGEQMNKKMAIPAAAAALALLLSGCGGASADEAAETTPSTSQTVEAPQSEETKDRAVEASFVDGVLSTRDVKIAITAHRVIPVGEPGNEYGSKPVLAFWYDITNVAGEGVTPMNWIFLFEAIQDNDPNAVNKLNVGGLPDDAFRDSQMQEIKTGGTIQSAIAYELDDETTPVDLIASEDLGMTEIGKITYNLQ